MWAGKKLANKRTSFNFSKIESVEKIDLDNSKNLFSSRTFLAFGFLTPEKTYPLFTNLGTTNLLKTQKAPLFFSFYLDRLGKFGTARYLIINLIFSSLFRNSINFL